MEETPRENVAMWVGIFSTVIPGMIVSGFWPELNVLPVGGWVAIAAIGSAIAGAIATPLMIRGILTGMLAGAGSILGIWAYVAIRSAIVESDTFSKIELVIGALLGATPGFLLYKAWARPFPSSND